MQIVLAAVLMFLSAIACSAASPPIGSVKSVRGNVMLVREGTSVTLTEGIHLIAGDSIRTQASGTAGVILLDGTRLAVGENTEMKLSGFSFEPSKNEYSLTLQVLKGILAYVSGKIAKISPGSVEIRTPVGVVGTRGTALAMKIEAGNP